MHCPIWSNFKELLENTLILRGFDSYSPLNYLIRDNFSKLVIRFVTASQPNAYKISSPNHATTLIEQPPMQSFSWAYLTSLLPPWDLPLAHLATDNMQNCASKISHSCCIVGSKCQNHSSLLHFIMVLCQKGRLFLMNEIKELSTLN